jgi:HSP20 family protein
MQLVRWSPLPELDAIDRRLRLVFDQAGMAPALLPAADVYETDAEFILELEVPGFEEEKLSVEVFDHTLTVKGERIEEKEEQAKTFRLHERLANEFERRFELPPEADSAKIAAEFKAGVLTVHAPKASVAKPRAVAIATK